MRSPSPAEVLLIVSAPAVSVACVVGEIAPVAMLGARLWNRLASVDCIPDCPLV